MASPASRNGLPAEKCDQSPAGIQFRGVPELLFSYGTLRQPEVQRRTFGRELDGRPDAAVDGTVFTISEADLAAADEYEVDDYVRVAVPLRSGAQAWVYVFADERLPIHRQ